MQNDLTILLEGTVLKFFFSKKGFDDCGYFWTDASFKVENKYFTYDSGQNFLEFSELRAIEHKLTALLSDEIAEEITLEFIEPDMQITLIPKRDLRNDPRYTYIKDGYEIEDISVQFRFFPVLDGAYTEQHYALSLYRSDIELFNSFLSEKLSQLKT